MAFYRQVSGGFLFLFSQQEKRDKKNEAVFHSIISFSDKISANNKD